MRGTKAKQLRRAAESSNYVVDGQTMPTRWVYRQLKHYYKSDKVNRDLFNAKNTVNNVL